MKGKMSRTSIFLHTSALILCMVCLASCREQRISETGEIIPFPARAVSAFITDSARVQSWWPGTVVSGQKWMLADTSFTVLRQGFQSTDMQIQTADARVRASIVVMPLDKDSCTLRVLAADTALQPRQAALLARTAALLTLLKTKLTSVEAVYGFDVRMGTMKDSVLLVQRKTFLQKPGPAQHYEMIERLRQYAVANGARLIDSPMLYLDVLEGKFVVQAGLSIDRKLPENDSFSIREMVMGNNLQTMVAGGPGKIAHALQALDKYRADYDKVSPAIPFQVLITHRMLQPDTAQWVTRLILPVM